MRGISHVAIGVSDMERSLRFYRDLLGLTVSLDKEEPVRGSERLFAEPAQNRRRAVYLKWADGPEAGLELLDAISGLDDYYLYHSARADLLRRAFTVLPLCPVHAAHDESRRAHIW